MSGPGRSDNSAYLTVLAEDVLPRPARTGPALLREHLGQKLRLIADTLTPSLATPAAGNTVLDEHDAALRSEVQRLVDDAGIVQDIPIQLTPNVIPPERPAGAVYLHHHDPETPSAQRTRSIIDG